MPPYWCNIRARCGAKRADIVCQHDDSHHHQDFHESMYYSILECRGCGEHYFKTCYMNSYDYTVSEEHGVVYKKIVKYWPPSGIRKKPGWEGRLIHKDPVLRSLFNDVYVALDNNLGVPAAIGMRTVFDRASELLGIDPEMPFARKLASLEMDDRITGQEKSVLEVLVEAGSAAAHRGWVPEPHQLDAMMAILEAFIHRAFILPDLGVELGMQVPKRKRSQRKGVSDTATPPTIS